jgi:hypothetical protein
MLSKMFESDFRDNVNYYATLINPNENQFDGNIYQFEVLVEKIMAISI